MSRKQKNYPMNGPSLHIQRLMERPRANRQELRVYFHGRNMRNETAALATIK